jgi:hypothetical protein
LAEIGLGGSEAREHEDGNEQVFHGGGNCGMSGCDMTISDAAHQENPRKTAKKQNPR